MQNKRNSDNSMEKNCPKPGGAAMIPRRNRDLTFGRNSFLFSYKRRYNGNLCACSVQQAKAASSMMPCTLSAPAEYFCQQRCFAQGTCLRRHTFCQQQQKVWKNAARNRWFLDFLYLQEACLLWDRQGNWLSNRPAPAQVKKIFHLLLGVRTPPVEQ